MHLLDGSRLHFAVVRKSISRPEQRPAAGYNVPLQGPCGSGSTMLSASQDIARLFQVQSSSLIDLRSSLCSHAVLSGLKGFQR